MDKIVLVTKLEVSFFLVYLCYQLYRKSTELYAHSMIILLCSRIHLKAFLCLPRHSSGVWTDCRERNRKKGESAPMRVRWRDSTRLVCL